MSAVNSNPSEREAEALRRAQRAHEPSMEEILASIRNIIADDRENAKASVKPASQRASAAAAGPQIVYSKDASAPLRAEAPAPAEPPLMRRGEAPTPEPQTNSPKVVWSQPPAAEEPVPESFSAPQAEADAASVQAAAKSEIAAKAESAVKPAPADESEPTHEPARPANQPLVSPATDAAVASSFEEFSAVLAARSAEVADGIIRDMLRPMLKTWLDENLPDLVERLVSAEIQRMSSRSLR